MTVAPERPPIVIPGQPTHPDGPTTPEPDDDPYREEPPPPEKD